MSILRNSMRRLKRIFQKIKLRNRVILIGTICILTPLIVSCVYFISTIRKFYVDNSLISIDVKTFLSYNIVGLIILGISIILSCFMIVIFSYRYTKRLSSFQRLMNKAALGEFEHLEIMDGHEEINDLYKSLNTLVSNMQNLVSTVFEEQVQKEKLYSRQRDVEFKMLASQINPHFLYNTLETIRMKARANNETEIEELVKMLAKILRRNIQVGDKLVTLKSELELVEYYLRIQHYRFGDRMSFDIDVKCNIDSIKIMPLLIQPIVENAFIHGLEPSEGKGVISIVVEIEDNRLIIHVTDNGKGMTEAELDKIVESLNDYNRLGSNHIGLNNVNQRIKLLYGDEYGLYIESAVDEGTSVRIELPNNSTQ